MKVWIAQAGERGAGSYILGVFTNEAAAIECALSKEAHFDNGEWRKQTEYPNQWMNGCDYVRVHEYEVDDKFTPTQRV